MFFPISDDDRAINRPVYVTQVLLLINVLVFAYQVSNPEFTYGWSVIPREITTGEDLVGMILLEVPDREPIQLPQAPGPTPIYLTLLTSMFMHSGTGHIVGNMLYLWIFGDNVEHRFGPMRFLIFYVSAGLAASIAQIMLDPNGPVPTLGASGAIAGVMGAYMVLFPRNRVNAVFLFSIVSVPAIVVLGMWILTQFVSGYGSIMQSAGQVGGVAYAAHIGGFITGVCGGLVARTRMPDEPDSILKRNYDRDPRARRIW